ncbi:hypothetical protein AMECASPLE_013926 [Ameca splendens]|uniref:Secreted protein n=1 Tax=Ameca splendens TaxID=208324 RepID=A0ABV0ZLX4_9TELE
MIGLYLTVFNFLSTLPNFLVPSPSKTFHHFDGVFREMYPVGFPPEFYILAKKFKFWFHLTRTLFFPRLLSCGGQMACVACPAPGSVLLCSLCVSALFSQTPSRSWQMAAHTEPGSGSAGGFFLLKGSFSSPLSLHACSV